MIIPYTKVPKVGDDWLRDENEVIDTPVACKCRCVIVAKSQIFQTHLYVFSFLLPLYVRTNNKIRVPQQNLTRIREMTNDDSGCYIHYSSTATNEEDRSIRIY